MQVRACQAMQFQMLLRRPRRGGPVQLSGSGAAVEAAAGGGAGGSRASRCAPSGAAHALAAGFWIGGPPPSATRKPCRVWELPAPHAADAAAPAPAPAPCLLSFPPAAGSVPSTVDIVVAPTFVHLDMVLHSLKAPFQIAAQVGGWVVCCVDVWCAVLC